MDTSSLCSPTGHGCPCCRRCPSPALGSEVYPIWMLLRVDQHAAFSAETTKALLVLDNNVPVPKMKFSGTKYIMKCANINTDRIAQRSPIMSQMLTKSWKWTIMVVFVLMKITCCLI